MKIKIITLIGLLTACLFVSAGYAEGNPDDELFAKIKSGRGVIADFEERYLAERKVLFQPEDPIAIDETFDKSLKILLDAKRSDKERLDAFVTLLAIGDVKLESVCQQFEKEKDVQNQFLLLNLVCLVAEKPFIYHNNDFKSSAYYLPIFELFKTSDNFDIKTKSTLVLKALVFNKHESPPDEKLFEQNLKGLLSQDSDTQSKALEFFHFNYVNYLPMIMIAYEKCDDETKRMLTISFAKKVNVPSFGHIGWGKVVISSDDWQRRNMTVNAFGPLVNHTMDMLIEIASKDGEKQFKAMSVLSDMAYRDPKYSGRILELLLKLKEDKDPEIALDAVKFLGRLGNSKACPILLKDFEQGINPKESLGALAKIASSDNLDFFIKEFEKKGDLAPVALEGICAIHNEASYKYLLKLLDDNKSPYRETVIKSFGHPQIPDVVVQNLVEIIQDKNDPARLATLQVLSATNHKELTPILIENFKKCEDVKTANVILGTIASLRERRATAFLMGIMENPREYKLDFVVAGMITTNYLKYEYPLYDVLPNYKKYERLTREEREEEVKKLKQSAIEKYKAWWEKNKANLAYHFAKK